MADRRGACHVERARPDFIGVPYECRFCTRRGDWAVRVETPLYNSHRVLGIGVLRLRFVREGGRTSAQDDKTYDRDCSRLRQLSEGNKELTCNPMGLSRLKRKSS